MMGKRVNYAARTIIAPDCQIDTNEIGIPKEFAMKLSVPIFVNTLNIDEVCQRINNGATVYPGCNFLTYPSGRILDFIRKPLNETQKANLCNEIRSNLQASLDNLDKIEGKPFILRRHLKNGDTVLMNRQPSLHKPSILAHFVRVLENQKCFRLHYTNCSGYNADFDGDEMNLHCLQNPTAQVEAAILMNADTNYTNPRNGAPLRGLIQDHIVSGALLTVKGTFLRKDEYLQIIYSAVAKYVDKNVCIEPPTIFYPVQLWTGKQVISSLLKTIVDYAAMSLYGLNSNLKLDKSFTENYKGINLQSKSKTSVTAWRGIITTDNDEATVVIQNSELLQGVFDKTQYGASFNGLVHVCSDWEKALVLLRQRLRQAA
uniref:DNA-directed RNA polymerase n=1 Tax=Dermatophagoides pteronyssinus TaxID=6956 RepID=A0A6P6XKB1_DERPT|nr:DNA-directed RNA polymerase I subunit RPA1-like [Dermatophagoides pteronyssinus]